MQAALWTTPCQPVPHMHALAPPGVRSCSLLHSSSGRVCSCNLRRISHPACKHCTTLQGQKASVSGSCGRHHCSRRTSQLRRLARCRAAESEARVDELAALFSQSVHEEIVLFILQLEYDVQLNRALHYDNFDAAQQIRLKRQQIDEIVSAKQAFKGEGAGDRPASGAAVDLATDGLRLRSELQRAIDEERYDVAASLRDQLKELQAQTDAAAASGSDQMGGDEVPRFRLGQRVQHAEQGARGVICGWDVSCCESEAWQEAADVAQLQRGASQPFYHVLVDNRDWPRGDHAPVAYVAEELLTAPEPPSSWVQEHGSDAFVHPYEYMLFNGTDARGDKMPIRKLLDKYRQQRQDVYPPDSNGDSDGKE